MTKRKTEGSSGRAGPLKEINIKLPPGVLAKLDQLAGTATAADTEGARWFRADVIRLAITLLHKRVKGSREAFQRIARGQSDLADTEEGQCDLDALDNTLKGDEEGPSRKTG